MSSSFPYSVNEIPEELWDFMKIRYTSCTFGYGLTESPLFVPAYRLDTSSTTYDAPGAQVSSSLKEVYGPAVEANGQYYADSMAYCRAIWATECNPNGSCPQDGMERILLSRVETTNYYGTANELIRTVTDRWVPTLTVAQPSDWRSGVVQGIPLEFNNNLSTTDLFRISRTDTTYYQVGNANVQKDILYNSLSSRGVGLGGNLDALQGIRTETIRTSTSTTTIDVAPDRLNSATTATTELETDIVLSTGRYVEPPDESGPYVLDAQIPVPLLFETEAEINASVEAYENYLTRMIKGEAYGLQIAEQMREDVATTWYPGQPFRYYDPSKDRVLAMRMDAVTWGVYPEEAAFVTEGLWLGFSNGDVTVPDNIVGNSLADMGGGATPPTTPILPTITNETAVDSGSFFYIVNINLAFSVEVDAPGNDGILPVFPTDLVYPVQFTSTCFVGGFIVEPGGILATDADGSVPIDSAGSLLIDGAVIVTADLFAT